MIIRRCLGPIPGLAIELDQKTRRVARVDRGLERHIETVVSHYRGKIWVWDVVNEPIEPKDGLDDGYRNSIWQRLLGIDHVMDMGRTALNVTGICMASAVVARWEGVDFGGPVPETV